MGEDINTYTTSSSHSSSLNHRHGQSSRSRERNGARAPHDSEMKHTKQMRIEEIPCRSGGDVVVALEGPRSLDNQGRLLGLLLLAINTLFRDRRTLEEEIK